MSGAENQVAVHDVVFPDNGLVDNLSDAVSKVSLRPDKLSPQSPKSVTDSLAKDKNDTYIRPFVMYSRPHLLFLHKSPLVYPPAGMPALKDWFGTESDQVNLKKDSEAFSQPNARDRRFRRDAEDGEGAARPSFRGAAITQPSQMGNFKHQPIRATDRDRDRDRDMDREQERESRVKDGQERLRNLSDKYDRDRRALSSVQQPRGKERDLTSQLGGTSSRISSQSQQTLGNRQLDPPRKKDGETSEDWRREPVGRERSDNPRRERDERERPRSRVGDSSRPRRDVSLSRRDRDRDDRDRDRRGDRDREDHQREPLGSRRDRDDHDFDRDSEIDDPRRWRDDGKRDERMAVRREREQRERDKDRVRDRPAAWDSGDRQDRRWAPADDRDGRNKRAAGRERKSEEVKDKDKDDRKDRDREREREREKEPAWMDTYIPSASSNGLGRAPGDLDDIQAFKREIKEREQKEQNTAAQDGDHYGDLEGKVHTSEPHLDEIQLFKLMMKREEQKKKADESPLAGSSLLADMFSETKNSATTTQDLSSVEITAEQRNLTPQPISSQLSASPSLPQPDAGLHDGSRALLSMLSSSSSPSTPSVPPSTREPDMDKGKLGGSRFFPKPIPAELPAPQALQKPAIEALAAPPSAPHAVPPPDCRLLNFTSKTPQSYVGYTPPSYTGSHSPVSLSKNGTPAINPTIQSSGPLSSVHHNDSSEAVRTIQGFSPFEEAREGLGLPPLDAFRRGSTVTLGDRNAFGHMKLEQTDAPISGTLPGGHPGPYEQLSSGVAAAKGSRFAKFFDGKGRDSQPGTGKGGPSPAQRSDMGGYNVIPGSNPDARAMEDIFAMLSNSAHTQRPHVPPEVLTSDAAHFNAPPSNPRLIQTQLGHPQHYPGHTRLDSLYDSRLDNRNFVPDGMVPGLRSVPPRSRQNSAMPSDIDDPMQFGGQRAQMYHGLHQVNMNRNGGVPPQPQFRGGPSPNPMQPSAQRLPPGLANLGGRPPHEPAQFLNSAMTIPAGLHNPVHGSATHPQQFNNFPPGFNGAPQMRVPHPGGTQQLHGHNAMQGLMHPGLNSAQAQLLGINGTNGIPGGLRGPNGGFQQPQIQPPLLSMRQQQQQQQIPPHILPLHYQQGPPNPNSQPAHDLMALLMNGGRRE